MFGIVSKNAVDHRAIEKTPPLPAQGFDIGPARPDIQRFVDRQARPIERQQHRQGREGPHEQSEMTAGKPPGSSPYRRGTWRRGHRGIHFSVGIDRWKLMRTQTRLFGRESGGHPPCSAANAVIPGWACAKAIVIAWPNCRDDL
jgi:hypothetical protein